ncbi:hypothetical protein V6N13_002486 [Hibiscus sabdariffa]|uniref:Uncharacterized protein n=1 Tax=Hibiscus sabdariffa TaxID=183260 RepID=A0ABR2C2Z5_9ROSI
MGLRPQAQSDAEFITVKLYFSIGQKGFERFSRDVGNSAVCKAGEGLEVAYIWYIMDARQLASRPQQRSRTWAIKNPKDMQ